MNSLLNADQVKNYKGGNYATYEDFMDARTVHEGPYKPAAQVVTVASQNYALLNSTMLPGKIIAKDTTTQQNDPTSVVAASLVGAVGGGAVTYVTDALGNILNKVQIRDSVTGNPIEDTDEKIVFGLIQCDNGAVDGSAVGASGSENLQISFVKEDVVNNLVLVAINKTIEFNIATVMANRFRPTLMKENGEVGADTKDLSSVNTNERVYIIQTANAPIGMQINLATDGLTGQGAATVDTTDPRSVSLGGSPLPNTGALFATNSKIQFYRNGQKIAKSDVTGSGDIGYVSSTTIQVNVKLAIGEELSVVVPQGY